MKQTILFFALLAYVFTQPTFADEPDSAYIFSYATVKNNGKNGLHYAWSIDRKNWHGIGPEFRFLFSDFGTWGSQKRLLTPFLFQDQQGTWHAIWSLNEQVGQFAHAQTTDLYTWEPQSYPDVMFDGNVMMPEVSYQPNGKNYRITWLSQTNGLQKVFKTTTTDFKRYTPTVDASENDRMFAREEVLIDGEKQTGTVSKVPWRLIDGLIRFYELSKYHERQRAERLTDDAGRFAGLTELTAEITADGENRKAISNMLIGVFFEDINYAADGGLYAELVQNRGFEYTPADIKFRDKNWNSKKAWSFTGNQEFAIDTVAPVHPHQKHYAVLTISKIGEALQNEGFDGIPLKAGDKYHFSVLVRGLDGARGKLLVRLVDPSGKVYAEGTTPSAGAHWKKLELMLTAKEGTDNAQLQLIPQFTGQVALDLVSLFPQKTFKERRNGLRADLAQAIADMHPRFVRFPGGCLAHGDGLENIYRWKNTIGPLESRKPDRNIWNYHQSMGLGYFEYFQFCEDIGAEPLPVVAAGVPCQNSSTGGHGQQGGIPMCEMDPYVQDILDLIEWANGDKNTQWGKKRAEAGHPEPFNLKYLGIGNEDLITDIFEERFTLIFNAIKEKHPEITVIGTVGPFSEGTDYRVGWEIASKLQVPLVDEHYYQPPGWYLNNQGFYDRYDRTKPKVYLGEYATHLPGRKLTVETALCDALHLINVERNADVVSMTSYAPLLAKHGHTQWNPDLIYFSNTGIFLTPDYYVQQLFGQNPGDEYIPTLIKLSINDPEIRKRVASSLVRDHKTGDYILKLANLLPVDVRANIPLTGLPEFKKEATLTVLKGGIEEEKVTPAVSLTEVNADFHYQLPAYSFSVIRFKMN